MALDHTKTATLPRALSTVIGDLADLVQKEVRLARAEVSDKLSAKLHGGIWLVVAGVFGFLALLLVIAAAVFAIASLGIGLHWACLIVAGVMVVLSGAAFFKGRSSAGEGMIPTRTVEQIKRDISTAKEQLT